MMVSKRESPIPGVSFSGSFWLNFGEGENHHPSKNHRRLTGSFQASPDPKVSEVPLQAGGRFKKQRWVPLEHDHKMDEKNLKDVISRIL